MRHTAYSNLTNKELLSALHLKRINSPVIEELCSRLEKIPDDKFDYTTDILGYVSCPVCEAQLKLKEETEALYTLLT